MHTPHTSEQIADVLEVDEFTLGLVGPDQEWAGTVRDGGTVKTHTPAGYWDPTIPRRSTASTR